MPIVKELIKQWAVGGASNLKKLLEMVDKLPSDSTLLALNETINKLIPYIPQIERALGDGSVKNLERLLAKMPDGATLDRLARVLPLLEKMPDKETLTKLLDKADSLKGFLDSID